MPIDLALVEHLAPDQASINAAKKLLAPSKWPSLEEDGVYAWGLCQGSGATPYRAVFDLRDHGSKCTCPSRKFPCKHVLALVWKRAERGAPFEAGERPEWIDEWQSRRRGASESDAQDGPRASVAAAVTTKDDPGPKDPARAAKQRQRNRERREAQVLAGLDELDRWIDDVLGRGLVASASGLDAGALTRRLFDAKAGALAERVVGVGARLRECPSEDRAAALVDELGLLELISQAYRRKDDLPPEVAADVREAIGWARTRDTLTDDLATGPLEVVARRSETQLGGLVRHETWLLQTEPGDGGAAPRAGVLVDFVPASSGAGASGPPAGTMVSGPLRYFESAVPLRGMLEEGGAVERTDVAPAHVFRRTLDEELEAMLAARASVPWLGHLPITADSVRVARTRSGTLWLFDPATETGLPLAHASSDEASVLLGLELDGVFGLHHPGPGGGRLELHRASTPLGVWRHT